MKLNAQKNTIYGERRNKRRAYLYFGQPCFVLPCVNDKARGSNLFSPINEDNEEGNISQEKIRKVPQSAGQKRRKKISY
jgi:hypothetical protein